MTPHYADDWLTVYGGDCREVMATMPADSVDCVITSPPYWGLRDYGTDGQLGLERTPEEYVSNMVAVFREVRRVLKPSGTCWLNLGDSYNGVGRGDKANGLQVAARATSQRTVSGLKPKDLVGIPWRVAFALQADGWYLRSDIIWSKLNPMPESVTDRPTKSHEYLFLLTKSSRYYFDADAVRETWADARNGNAGVRGTYAEDAKRGGGGDKSLGSPPNVSGRNIRSVWTIATRPYPGAHFAVFPSELPERCIKAGSSEKGVCPECGAPWERVVERPNPSLPAAKGPKGREYGTSDVDRRSSFHVAGWRKAEPDIPTTTGWRPTCRHYGATEYYAEGHPPIYEPAVILDPFAGSGTVGMVANRLSRRATLIDLNPEYLKQQMRRNAQTPMGLVG